MKLKTLSRMTGIPVRELKIRLAVMNEKIEPRAFRADARGYSVRKEAKVRFQRSSYFQNARGWMWNDVFVHRGDNPDRAKNFHQLSVLEKNAREDWLLSLLFLYSHFEGENFHLKLMEISRISD